MNARMRWRRSKAVDIKLPNQASVGKDAEGVGLVSECARVGGYARGRRLQLDKRFVR